MLMKENLSSQTEANPMSDRVMQEIELRMAQKGIDLNLLSDQELSTVAERFLGDAPPGHLPRETIIATLKDQKEIQNWAMGIKTRVAAAASEQMTDTTRAAVTQARSAYQGRMESDPRLAMITEKFGEWLKESNYNAAQLTAMADANQDGMISNEEILNLIRTMSNAEPPGWVADLVAKHIDADGNGMITLPEWWAFLESIGFENAAPALPEPMIPEPVLAEPKPVPSPEPVLAEPKAVLSPEPEPAPAPMSEPIVASVVAEALPVPVEVVAPVAAAAVAVAAVTASAAIAPPAQPEIAAAPTTPVVQGIPSAASTELATGHVGIIESLWDARLLSEFNAIVAQSTSQTSSIKVEKVERTLMATGEYRGGQTITGTLDESEHTVTMRFPVSETEFVEGLKKGQVVKSEGIIYRWSGALKQANLESTGARI